jgi:hypothetical protein
VIDKKIDGKHVPVNYIIRAAQSKSVAMVQDELTRAKSGNSDGETPLGMRFFSRLPDGVQHFLWRRITRDPLKRRALEGTVLVSDVTPFCGRRSIVRGIAPSGASATLLFVSIAKQPWVVGETVVPRDILHLTCSADHRIVDGSIMLGLRYLVRLLESGSELPTVESCAGGSAKTTETGTNRRDATNDRDGHQ